MALNKALEDARAITLAAPAGVTSGEPLLFGVLAAVAQTDRGTVSLQASLDFQGAYFLSVTATTSISPGVGSAVKPGDNIYAEGGTLDATTGITQGMTLNKNSSGVFYGTALDALGSGLTGTIRVRLGGKAA